MKQKREWMIFLKPVGENSQTLTVINSGIFDHNSSLSDFYFLKRTLSLLLLAKQAAKTEIAGWNVVSCPHSLERLSLIIVCSSVLYFTNSTTSCVERYFHQVCASNSPFKWSVITVDYGIYRSRRYVQGKVYNRGRSGVKSKRRRDLQK